MPRKWVPQRPGPPPAGRPDSSPCGGKTRGRRSGRRRTGHLRALKPAPAGAALMLNPSPIPPTPWVIKKLGMGTRYVPSESQRSSTNDGQQHDDEERQDEGGG